MYRVTNPFEDFSSIFRGFDNLLQQFLGDFEPVTRHLLPAGAEPVTGLPAPRWSRMVYPAVESFRRGDEIVFRAELPGVDPKDLSVSVEDNRLILRGEKKMKKEADDADHYLREVFHGRFERVFDLPKGLKPEQLKARFENGVLEITLPAEGLHAAARRVPIQITSGETKGLKSA
ncbi:MAG: Hsp20/alpha crystallin family protein [Acidobacteriota bacterium]